MPFFGKVIIGNEVIANFKIKDLKNYEIPVLFDKTMVENDDGAEGMVLASTNDERTLDFIWKENHIDDPK